MMGELEFLALAQLGAVDAGTWEGCATASLERAARTLEELGSP